MTAAIAASTISRWPPPSPDGAPGSGIAILVNANAKRGGRRVAVQIAQRLRGATVRLTKTPREIDTWLQMLPKPRVVLAAGGDGTAVALLNALLRAMRDIDAFPTVGVLPLGTGNGWANALGAPRLHTCLDLLARAPTTLPTRRSGLVEVDGMLAHFAGTGWDAMIVDDYKRQLHASKGPGRRFSKSVYGYVSAALLRTAPKVAVVGNPHVVIENLGDEVFAVAPDGKLQRLCDAVRGTILFSGQAGIASVGACPEFGYKFRAFPFAERLPGFMNVRAYEGGPFDALASVARLWRGAHPVPGMHDWLAHHVRMTFSCPVPLQIGGDAHGWRRTVEFRAADRCVQMLDWRRLRCL